MAPINIEQKTKIARVFIDAIPYARCLAMELDGLADGVAEISMPYNAELIGDPDTKVVHGGVVSALMDTCCGTAVIAHPADPIQTATIDLRIDYMRGANPGDRLMARAECYKMTRSVAFVRAEAFDADLDRPVATATGAFTVEFADAKAGNKTGHKGNK